MYTNFMKQSFKHYYAPDERGGYKEVTRNECFGYDADSFNGKFPQCWYWDSENDFAIRLERNKAGEKIYNEARAERLRVWKTYLEQFGCVRKVCVKCRGWEETHNGESKCDSCTNHVTFVALDEEIDDPNGDKPVRLEIGADTDVESEALTTHLLDVLQKVLQTLDRDDRVLWQFLVAETKKNVIAAHFGWTLDKLSYRQLKLYTKLRSNQALKNFFEKR